ncbi:uncharacterized protein C1orf112 homolog [Polyodon spathula]|uniref:uncharacterized protein C1orf112 homolog n=1 Tax=Polyodon spathula TaxID=7913 RepID=UPI001B7E99DB|nr:uncharacterized protein C1orf112 homolog [Polyodon spathula]
MSQTTLLGEITQWNEDMCRRELKSVLPKLVSMYQHADSRSEHIRVLKILTEMFLPHLNLAELEEECFSKLLPKVVNMFNDLMDELSNQAGGLSSQNTELRAVLRNILQTMVQVLEALSGCVRHVCSFEQTLVLESIRSLPSSVLHILKNTFLHCKMSESAYSGRLSMVADLLQALFKEAYSLQKVLMELLDRISLEPAAAEEVVDMVTVIHSLLDICSVISNMDHALHANTWKFIIKQSIKHQSLLEEQLRHKDIVFSLCDDMLLTFQSCMQLAEQMNQSGTQQVTQSAECKLFQKTGKLCRFFAHSLVHYVKEFKSFVAQSCGRLHLLYLQIYSKFPPSVYASKLSDTHSGEINAVILVALDPLITQLLSLRPFVEEVLTDKQHSSAELFLPQCLLLVTIMDKLPTQPEEVLGLWCQGSQFPEETPRLSLFQAMFLSFQQCYTELALPIQLPGVMMNGQAQSKVTLYHHVCVHLCAFIASVPRECFPPLERSLLAALLCPDTETALLSADAWCFLARYGSAELCKHHMIIIAQLIKSCPGECYQLSNLSLLLRRMMFLMTIQHQVEFVERFSPKEVENVQLWQHVPLKALTPDLRKQVVDDIMRSAGAVCSRWLEGRCMLVELEQVNTALSAMLCVCRESCGVVEEKTLAFVMGLISQLWTCMSVKQVQSQRCVQCTLQLLLSLSAIFVQNLDPQAIYEVVTFLSSLQPLNSVDHIFLAALDFLASLGKFCFPQEVQGQVLPKLSSLFASLLAERSWLLHQHALEAFTHFAEETSHEEVVPKSLSSEEIKNNVVNFLNKKIVAVENEDTRVERLKSERSVLQRLCAGLEPVSKEETEDLQPYRKRARQETPEEEVFEKVLHTAEHALKTLQALLQQTPAPNWMAARLQGLVTHIHSLNSCKLQGL